MKSLLEERLKALKVEFEKGQDRLKELQKEATETSNTLLRISGAIQVLEEELQKEAERSEAEIADTNAQPNTHHP